MGSAFEISAEDILVVLLRYPCLPRFGMKADFLARRIFDCMTQDMFDLIEDAALKSGFDIDTQTDGAHETLREIIRESFSRKESVLA